MAMQISRRSFLTGATALAAATALGGFLSPGSTAIAAPDRLAQDTDLGLSVDVDGFVTITRLLPDGTTTDLVRLENFRITGEVSTTTATVEDDSVDPATGVHTVRVRHTADDPAYQVVVTYTSTATTVMADFDLWAPASLVLPAVAVHRTLLGSDVPEWSPTPAEIQLPVSRWTRDERGGVPARLRTADIYLASWDGGDVQGAFVMPPLVKQPGRPVHNETFLNAVPTLIDPGHWHAVFSFRTDALVGQAWTRFSANQLLIGGALLTAPDLAIELEHSATFNVFAAPGVQTFELGVYTAADQDVHVDITVRDFDGTVIQQAARDITTVGGAAADTLPVDIDLPDTRGYYFLETTAMIAATGATAFTRTAAATLPPHRFGPAEQSIIGLGGFSQIRAEGGSQAPGNEPPAEEHALWDRMGVRHLRNNWLSAEESEQLAIHTAYQPSGSFPDGRPVPIDDPAAFREWANIMIDRGVHVGARHFELLNEWNLQKGGLLAGGRAAEYTRDWLLPFREVLDERGTGAKLNSVGLGSWDPVFIDIVRENGGWDALDGVAMHPGRGNFTADYDPVTEPAPGNTSDVWNFYGAVRSARAYLDQYGPDKELWLTEVYAVTKPNLWWGDSERIATDNTLLELALSLATRVTGVHWFQLYDSVWSDKYGSESLHTDPMNKEYDFGLLHTDRSPKPSFMSFVHAAELLDGAEFLGWVESPHPDLRGLRFHNADGPFWILWSRQDGYLNFADHGEDTFYPHPEAWEDPTIGSLTVQVPGDPVVTDAIGRDLTAQARGTGVTITASPVVVTGVDPDAVGPDIVDGPPSVDVSDVSVSRDEDDLVVTGTNGTGATLTLWVEDALAHPTTLDVGPGAFTARLPDTVPAGQVRVLAEVRADGQVHRADFYRTPVRPDAPTPTPTPDPSGPTPTPAPGGPTVTPAPTPTGRTGDGGGLASTGSTGSTGAGLAAVGSVAALAGAALTAYSRAHRAPTTPTPTDPVPEGDALVPEEDA